MRSPGGGAVVVLLVLGLSAAGCNRVPAEEALAEAEQALEGARAQIEEFAPEKLAPLDRSLEEARAALAEGRYTDALRLAQELPSRIHRAAQTANRRKLAATLSHPRPPPAPEGAVARPVE